MEDQLKTYRQPLVTATGIILGFILNFASDFVQTDTKNNFVAYVVATCILIGVICLIIVLSRVLRMRYPKDKAETYYNKTLGYFIFGVSISFVGIMIKMIEHFNT
jgi:Na+/melibiose symporter-like transporter